MINGLDTLFISKENYDLFLKAVEEKLSDESKLAIVLDELKEKIENGIKDLDIKENDKWNILTVVLSSQYFSPQKVFICDVHLIKQPDGHIKIKY
ncbi:MULTISPECIES: hypothetical protein [Enterococcaceae]|uniref:hypothetical protein n=1 Tax=Enterococcaceae TaxID=81852 RepID=UPI000E48F460|nr:MULTISPECIES: hypothetical protein [Enterococcaceae]MCI0131141.1 hypothetical protein [Vagococcus sp. CY53-2]RGI29748.1 hypothetical protein DXC12_07710 [Melissococcus sp. OM08-11BH]